MIITITMTITIIIKATILHHYHRHSFHSRIRVCLCWPATVCSRNFLAATCCLVVRSFRTFCKCLAISSSFCLIIHSYHPFVSLVCSIYLPLYIPILLVIIVVDCIYCCCWYVICVCVPVLYFVVVAIRHLIFDIGTSVDLKTVSCWRRHAWAVRVQFRKESINRMSSSEQNTICAIVQIPTTDRHHCFCSKFSHFRRSNQRRLFVAPFYGTVTALAWKVMSNMNETPHFLLS